MEFSQINFDIFSQKITPINTYILIGDKNPEIEIKSYYLDRLINKGKGQNGNNIIIESIKASLNTGETQEEKLKKNSSKRPQTERNGNFINLENDVLIDNSILNKSFDKISTKFLSDTYVKGEYSAKNINQIELSKEQMNKFKLPKTNPFIYSLKKLHPFSIFYGTKYNRLVKNNELTLPEPYYIEKDEWSKPVDNSFKAILEGVKIQNDQGLVIDSPKLKKKFSGIVGDIILQILRVPFGHHISLNIKIFEPDTVLSRYTKLFSFANVYLLQACNPNLTPYERFKFVIAFYFAGLYIGTKQLKPFNPFLGETFQGEFENGAKLYVENVTHKPLVARFLVRYKKKYEISGYWDLDVSTQSLGNEMIIQQKGPIIVKFPEINETFYGHIPFGKAVNARSEEKRATLFFGSLVCADPKHNYKAWIQFDYNKKIFHEIRGCTMNYEFPKDYKYDANKEWEFGLQFRIDNDIKTNQMKTKMKDNYTINENISGSFIEHLKIGNDIIWDIDKNLPDTIKPVKHCLPSDGRFREDLIWLYRSFYGIKEEKEEEIYRAIGMKWKVMMEEFNRWERKHRADYKEYLKKKKK